MNKFDFFSKLIIIIIIKIGHEIFFPYEQRPVHELTHKKSLTIMATAWAAMSHLRSGNLNASRPLCNWLLSQMKSNGKFVSFDVST